MVGDFLRDEQGLERLVLRVAQDQLERVRPRFEIELGFCLTSAEMQVLPVGRDRLVRIDSSSASTRR